MFFIDSHAHLDHPDFKGGLDEVVERARNAGVATITMGGSMHSNKAALELSKRFKGVHAAMGVSPFDALKEDVGPVLDFMGKHAKEMVAVGEIGLDYHYFSKEEDRQKQLRAFRELLAFAETYDLPCSIHTRKAEEKVLEVLREYGCRKILHCFLQPRHLAAALGGDCWVSVPTLKSKNAVKILTKAPIGKLLCETDSPFLWEGRNEPANVVAAYESAAKAKGMAPEGVRQEIYSSAKELFGF